MNDETPRYERRRLGEPWHRWQPSVPVHTYIKHLVDRDYTVALTRGSDEIWEYRKVALEPQYVSQTKPGWVWAENPREAYEKLGPQRTFWGTLIQAGDET